jgi:hypothetical protein
MYGLLKGEVLTFEPRGLTSITAHRNWHVFPRRPCLLALLALLCHLGSALTHQQEVVLAIRECFWV